MLERAVTGRSAASPRRPCRSAVGAVAVAGRVICSPCDLHRVRDGATVATSSVGDLDRGRRRTPRSTVNRERIEVERPHAVELGPVDDALHEHRRSRRATWTSLVGTVTRARPRADPHRRPARPTRVDLVRRPATTKTSPPSVVDAIAPRRSPRRSSIRRCRSTALGGGARSGGRSPAAWIHRQSAVDDDATPTQCRRPRLEDRRTSRDQPASTPRYANAPTRSWSTPSSRLDVRIRHDVTASRASSPVHRRCAHVRDLPEAGLRPDGALARSSPVPWDDFADDRRRRRRRHRRRAGRVTVRRR